MSELLLVANSGDGTISTLLLHTEPLNTEPLNAEPPNDDGEPRLAPLATSAVGEGCSTFAIDTDRDLVYAAIKGEPAWVVTLRLDRETGKLAEVSRRPVEASMSYLSLARDGALLLGASYGGGLGTVWPVDDGVLGEPRSRVEFANLHCVVPNGDRAYFVSLGEDLVAQFALDEDGTLRPLQPPTVAAPDGSGPRHLVLDGSDGYLITEFSGEAIRLEVDTNGALSTAESVRIDDPAAGLAHSRYGADPAKEHLIWGADVHRAGPWLLCSERTASTITTVAVRDGHLHEVVAITPTEAQPRGFVVAPGGRHVIAVGERSTHAALSRIEDDGSLTLLQRAPVGAGANWARFA